MLKKLILVTVLAQGITPSQLNCKSIVQKYKTGIIVATSVAAGAVCGIVGLRFHDFLQGANACVREVEKEMSESEKFAAKDKQIMDAYRALGKAIEENKELKNSKENLATEKETLLAQSEELKAQLATQKDQLNELKKANLIERILFKGSRGEVRKFKEDLKDKEEKIAEVTKRWVDAEEVTKYEAKKFAMASDVMRATKHMLPQLKSVLNNPAQLADQEDKQRFENQVDLIEKNLKNLEDFLDNQ